MLLVPPRSGSRELAPSVALQRKPLGLPSRSAPSATTTRPSREMATGSSSVRKPGVPSSITSATGVPSPSNSPPSSARSVRLVPSGSRPSAGAASSCNGLSASATLTGPPASSGRPARSFEQAKHMIAAIRLGFRCISRRLAPHRQEVDYARSCPLRQVACPCDSGRGPGTPRWGESPRPSCLTA